MPENVNVDPNLTPFRKPRQHTLQPQGAIKQNKPKRGQVMLPPLRMGPGAETWPKLSNLLAISASHAHSLPPSPALPLPFGSCSNWARDIHKDADVSRSSVCLCLSVSECVCLCVVNFICRLALLKEITLKTKLRASTKGATAHRHPAH